MQQKKDNKKIKKNNIKLAAGPAFILLTVSIISICTAASGFRMKRKLEGCEREINTYNALIREEKGREKTIENLDFYLGTKSFVEKTAREKFGLVYPDETVFMSDEEIKGD